MFKKKPESLRLTLRALAHLLSYPDAELRAEMQQLADALQVEQALKTDRLAELVALCRQLATSDPMEAESRYVETFDRGRSSSLHLLNTCMATRATGAQPSSICCKPMSAPACSSVPLSCPTTFRWCWSLLRRNRPKWLVDFWAKWPISLRRFSVPWWPVRVPTPA